MKSGNKILILLFVLVQITNLSYSQSYYERRLLKDVSTSSNNEVCPVMTSEGLVFCSDKVETSTKTYTDKKLRSPFSMYIARRNEDRSFKSPELFSINLSILQNDGPVSFNVNQDFLVFSRNFKETSFGNNMKDNKKMGLFFAELVNGEWNITEEFRFNDREANTSHPSLSADGLSLYFASDREGGFGGWDLYVSKKVRGQWTEPVNLGPTINTSSDELFPFAHPSGRLYFSSDGHDRIGGFDIFYSEFVDSRWFRPVKLPRPFNSGADDFTFYIDENFEQGFYTTKRRSLDIYTFQSTIPTFDVCQKQRENNYCYIFYEENTMQLDSTVYLYEWDLGDNTKIRAVEAEHCFEGPGDYLVQLNVVDKLTNLVEFNQAEYLVEVRKIIQPYITGPDTIYINQKNKFDGDESYFGDAKPGEYFWDFGDGNKAIGESVTFTYTVPGTYQLKLGVIEDSQETETERQFCSYKTVIVKEEELEN